MVLLEILWNDILPLLVFLLVGWILDARLKPDLNTYTKLITRIVLPLFIFYSLYLYPPDASAALLVPAGIALLFFDSLAALALAKILGFTERKARIFRALSTFSNSGQIGVALILMIFSHAPYLAGGEMPYLDEARGTIVVLLIPVSYTHLTLPTILRV